MTIAIAAASGQLGRLAVKAVRARAPSTPLVALARSPGKVADLGVEAREADYTKPDTLEKAFAGVATLLLISSSEIGQRAAQHRNAIAAAKKAGVRRVVYTSMLHTDRSPLSLAAEHAATEAELKASGLPFTILRNGWYTENYLGAVQAAVQHGVVIGSAGEGRISGATRADYAEAAAVALTGTGHAGRTYELAGDAAFTLADLASELSRQSGKRVVYENLPQDKYAAALAGFGLPAGIAAAVASWDVGASQGALFDDGHALSALIGRPTTPLSGRRRRRTEVGAGASRRARRVYSAARISARMSARKSSIGASAPARSTCQKVQPLQAGSPCASAPILWIEPIAGPSVSAPSARIERAMAAAAVEQASRRA